VQACVAAGVAKGEVVHIDASLIRANVSWESLAVRHMEAVDRENAAPQDEGEGEPADRQVQEGLHDRSRWSPPARSTSRRRSSTASAPAAATRATCSTSFTAWRCAAATSSRSAKRRSRSPGSAAFRSRRQARAGALGSASKLSRTYAALLEALNRHRGKGRQVIRIERVTVEAGGQAIVGAVTQGGGGACSESEGRAHAQAALAHAPEPALRCADPQGRPVPVASGEGQETVSDARRGRRQRRTGGQ
jgi:hypothetical protein